MCASKVAGMGNFTSQSLREVMFAKRFEDGETKEIRKQYGMNVLRSKLEIDNGKSFAISIIGLVCEVN